MRTSENKMCDNQPHTEAAGKERLFSVYVCMCECHDQKTKGRKNGKESRRIVNASYIIMIYKYNFATKAGCSVYIVCFNTATFEHVVTFPRAIICEQIM